MLPDDHELYIEWMTDPEEIPCVEKASAFALIVFSTLGVWKVLIDLFQWYAFKNLTFDI